MSGSFGRRVAAVFVLTVLFTWSTVSAAAASDAVFYEPPTDAPVADPFRPPRTRYGPGNRGLAYDLAPASAVGAIGPGTVVFAGQVGGTLHVTVEHPDGLRSSYSFLEDIAVRVGQVVRAADPLGRAGAGFHLGVRDGTTYIDPASIFGLVDVDVRLVPHDEPVRPTPESLLHEHRILRDLVRDEGGGSVLDRVGDAWDVVYDAGTGVVREVWDGATLLHQLVTDLAPLGIVSDVVITLWERHRADCTPGAIAADVLATTSGAGGDVPARAPLGPPGTRRVAVLVGGLGSSSRDAAIDEVDLDALGYAPGDAVRFSYRGARVPAGPGSPAVASDLATIPATDYEPGDTNADLRAQGRALADLLEQTAAAAPGAVIDVYAHSQGGLVTRYALLVLAERHGRLDAVGVFGSGSGLGQVATIGTPHGGADLATAAAAAGDELHVILDGAAAALGVGIDADGESVVQMAESSDLIAELEDRGVPEGVQFRTIGARGDLIVTADKSDVDGHPRTIIDLMDPRAHDRLPADPATTQDLALGLAGLDPRCESFANAVLDTVVPKSYSVVTDALSLRLLLDDARSVRSGRRGPSATPGGRDTTTASGFGAGG